MLNINNKNSKNELIKIIRLIILGFSLSLNLQTKPVSLTLVYNLRTQVPKWSSVRNLYPKPRLWISNIFNSFIKTRDDVDLRLIAGGQTFIFANDRAFVRADLAAGQPSEKTECIDRAVTQLDDIIVSTGYSWKISNKIRFTIAGLSGIPTHKDKSPTALQMGFAHFSLGIQSYLLLKYASYGHIRITPRYVRFFPRKTNIKVDRVNKCFKYNVGNLANLLLVNAFSNETHKLGMAYELGAKWGGSIQPSLDNFTPNIVVVANEYYIGYEYKFEIRGCKSAVALNFSYGFDFIPKDFGAKRVISSWVDWIINF